MDNTDFVTNNHDEGIYIFDQRQMRIPIHMYIPTRPLSSQDTKSSSVPCGVPSQEFCIARPHKGFRLN